MKKTIKVPYGLKKLALGAAVVALPVFTSCEKDKDPIQERIEQLTALEKVQAAEVRAAVQQAKTVDTDITPAFNNQWNIVTVNSTNAPTNILDSARVFKAIVTNFRQNAGDPIPKNNTTLTALYDKSNAYILTAGELAQLSQGR